MSDLRQKAHRGSDSHCRPSVIRQQPDAVRPDPALDPFRQREDFQKLLQEVEQKSAAKPEKKP